MSGGRKHPKYENITSRWGGMKVREEFAERMDKWLNAFAESDRIFLLELLKEFYYYSEERIKEKVVDLYNSFIKQFDGPEDEVVYTNVIKEYGVAYSDILFTTFWMQKEELYSQAEKNILDLLMEEQIPKVIAIIDDYSGTGKTFIKTIDKMIQTNKRVEDTIFYFLTLHITQRAIDFIDDYKKEMGLEINIISLDYSDETFKKHNLYSEIEAEQKKRKYLEICEGQRIDNMMLGFEDVASLVAFHYNTPNNTLGLFWKDLSEFAALFPRKKKKKTDLSSMQRAAKNRKYIGQTPVFYGINDGKMAVMLTYCLGQEKFFSVKDFVATFGLTATQADDFLREMIVQGYMTIEAGKFRPTIKLKSNAFMSRVKDGQSRFNETKQEPMTKFQVHEKYIPCNFK